MITLSKLQSRSGTCLPISFDPGALQPLAKSGDVDAYIVASEDGFSPLGLNRKFLASDLGVDEEMIGALARWNRFENERFTLVAIPSQRRDSQLRGVILAPSETSACYKRLPTRGRPPHRSFYYNVSYESIAYICSQWGARRLAISHLSASGHFHEDIATCNAEALAHYFDANPNEIQSFTFLGCCISERHLAGIARLNAEGGTGKHWPITFELEKHPNHSLIHLSWGRSQINGT
jgi:hypothetical protein